jgi:hypothetical protein
VGVGLRKKPKHLSASEREERGHGEGVGVYATLLQSDTGQPYGRAKAGPRPVGVGLRKKPKHLSASEREERGHGEGVSAENENESALCTTYDVVCSRNAGRHL